MTRLPQEDVNKPHSLPQGCPWQAGQWLSSGTIGNCVHHRRSSSVVGGQVELGSGVGQNSDVEKFPGGSDVWDMRLD